ncbi:MAG: citrate (Si)-synthase, partial [Methylococcales bacterium]
MAKETISIINNSTGESAEYPLLKGSAGTPVADIRKISQDLGIFTYDLGYVSTASCKSAITFIDGEKGILLYR